MTRLQADITYLSLAVSVSTISIAPHLVWANTSIEPFSPGFKAQDLSLSKPTVKQLTTEQLLILGEQKICLKKVDPRMIQNQVWAHDHLKLKGGRHQAKAFAKDLTKRFRGGNLKFESNTHRSHSFAAPRPELNYGMGVKSGDLQLKVEYRF